ncbi:hypothetical protein NADE_008763 [Nannochloris sp. 'desiccata']|nr:hypothetical protein NADE_008763 [Chlorella desiccata (nom. nud.)]
MKATFADTLDNVGNQGINVPAATQENGLDTGYSLSNPLNWPPKKPFTVRFAVALYNTSADSSITAREIEIGYQFWEYELNKRGGIPIGESKNALVEVKFLYYNKKDLVADSRQHQDLLNAAIAQGEVDFLLGGETSFAADELLVSQKQKRIAMLCCHGPPLVYQQAAYAAFKTNTENKLFGIHINSELYTNRLIRSIIVNNKANKIALVYSSRESIFTSTAVNSTMAQLQRLNSSGIYSNFPHSEVIEIPQQYTEDLEYHKAVARKIRDEEFDTVLAFTLNSDGKCLLIALQEEKPRLKTLFVTVTPTNKGSVEALTASGVRMEHILSAGQWHVQLNFAEDEERLYSAGEEGVLWPTSTDFAKLFVNYTSTYKNSTEPVTYTQASAAAAAYTLQLGITAAFKECQGIDSWDGSTSSLFYVKPWSCGSRNANSLGNSQQSGYELVLRALRSLNRDTFFGKILFSTDQRNVGRDAVTFQLLDQSEVQTDKFLGAVDFGFDAFKKVSATTDNKVKFSTPDGISSLVRLIQEVVLPSEYETRSLVLPRPPREDDSDWCLGGYGLDVTSDCQPCQPGEYRDSFVGEAGDSFKFTCLKCNFTSYQEKEGATECNPCPNFSETGILGAVSLYNCTCQSGFYNETFLPGVNCTYCPQGAECPGGVEALILEEGYWSENVIAGRVYRPERGEFDILPCNPPSSCYGKESVEEECTAGWGGALCSQCGYNNAVEGEPRYFLVFGSCIKCTSEALNLVYFLAVMVLWLIINLSMAEELQSFALLIDWFQLMSLVGAMSTIKWPSSLQTFFSISQIFAFEVDVISLRCINPEWGFLYDMVLQFSLPLAVIAFYIILGLCVKFYRRNQPKPVPLIENKKPKNEEEKCNEKGLSTKRSNRSNIRGTWSFTSFLKAAAPAAPTPLLPKVATSFKRGLSRAASLTVRNLEKRKVHFTFDDIWRRALNILEITYLASVQYSFSALRGIVVGGQTVVAKAPYTPQTTSIVVIGALGLACYGVAFTVYLIIQLWVLSPDCPFRKLPDGVHTKEKDPGGFIDKRHQKWLEALFVLRSWIKYETEKAGIAYKANGGLENFVKVIKDLAAYKRLRKTDDYSWLSMNDEAELWRSLVNQYPGIVAYIFNGSDDEVEYLYNFYVTFYNSYWNMQESWFGRWYNSLYKVDMKAYWESLVSKLTGEDNRVTSPRAAAGSNQETKNSSVFLARTASITITNRKASPEKMYDAGSSSGKERLDSSKDVDRVEHVAWLLQSRDRPFIARWLALIESQHESRRHFKRIINDISVDTMPICYQEKAMKILSLGMLSLFHKQATEARSSTNERGYGSFSKTLSVGDVFLNEEFVESSALSDKASPSAEEESESAGEDEPSSPKPESKLDEQ